VQVDLEQKVQAVRQQIHYLLLGLKQEHHHHLLHGVLGRLEHRRRHQVLVQVLEILKQDL